ncbi:hypothetical protein GCM10010112_78140 [Actinoplanes lobatus]|uniref:Uncharacterized protein n=1 Tax=Actinoplanes lobatus TaxID=113568 RepID=A0A7W7HN14_9ACTN|nr:hypothetical protein [Actinoplanes lobatus]MBB4753518.1 hypothetical protein [Actinoplanes lobatus]GGN91709.1 hypothetical protein GCM10010112_78140 [Actinoplanes lobatus]GIE38051.1 hypothetical protein Alo02nite_09490 [Actinoplanes lobatus]
MKALLNSLSETELALFRETEREQLIGADEDGLVELHGRVRRARDKYVGLYRREASARVATSGGRGKARPKNLRNAEKAEVFEDALARVSRHLAAAARSSAQELKNERLAAAQEMRNTAPPTVRARPAGKRATPTRATKKAAPAGRVSPGAGQAARKRQAASAATGARRQGRRDSW